MSLKCFFSIEKKGVFFGLSLPDAPRPSALRATWPCSERALQMTCTQSSAHRRRRPCYCHCHPVWPKPGLLRARCFRARSRGVRCTTAPGGRRPRSPPWHRRGDQSRRRAISGPSLRALVKSTSREGRGGRGESESGHKAAGGAGSLLVPLYVLLLWACCTAVTCRAALV